MQVATMSAYNWRREQPNKRAHFLALRMSLRYCTNATRLLRLPSARARSSGNLDLSIFLICSSREQELVRIEGGGS